MTLRSRLTAAFVAVVLVPLLVVIALVTAALPAAVAGRQEQGLTSSARLAAEVVAQLCGRARATAEAAGRAMFEHVMNSRERTLHNYSAQPAAEVPARRRALRTTAEA